MMIISMSSSSSMFMFACAIQCACVCVFERQHNNQVIVTRIIWCMPYSSCVQSTTCYKRQFHTRFKLWHKQKHMNTQFHLHRIHYIDWICNKHILMAYGCIHFARHQHCLCCKHDVRIRVYIFSDICLMYFIEFSDFDLVVCMYMNNTCSGKRLTRAMQHNDKSNLHSIESNWYILL